MKLVEFQFDHLELFDWRENEFNMYNAGSELLTVITKAAESGLCHTALHDGRILGLGGIIPLSKKTGYCFTIFSRHSDSYPVASARLGKRMFTGMVRDMELHRVVTYNLVDNSHHHKWCEWLGFKAEGVLEKFDDLGRSYIQYAWVKNGD